jgi:hypothetical protein
MITRKLLWADDACSVHNHILVCFYGLSTSNIEILFWTHCTGHHYATRSDTGSTSLPLLQTGISCHIDLYLCLYHQVSDENNSKEIIINYILGYLICIWSPDSGHICYSVYSMRILSHRYSIRAFCICRLTECTASIELYDEIEEVIEKNDQVKFCIASVLFLWLFSAIDEIISFQHAFW